MGTNTKNSEQQTASVALSLLVAQRKSFRLRRPDLANLKAKKVAGTTCNGEKGCSQFRETGGLVTGDEGGSQFSTWLVALSSDIISIAQTRGHGQMEVQSFKLLIGEK